MPPVPSMGGTLDLMLYRSAIRATVETQKHIGDEPLTAEDAIRELGIFEDDDLPLEVVVGRRAIISWYDSCDVASQIEIFTFNEAVGMARSRQGLPKRIVDVRLRANPGAEILADHSDVDGAVNGFIWLQDDYTGVRDFDHGTFPSSDPVKQVELSVIGLYVGMTAEEMFAEEQTTSMTNDSLLRYMHGMHDLIELARLGNR